MWYVLVQEEQLGPMTFQEVLEFYYKDMITRENLVWRDGMAGWLSIDQTPEFIEVLFKGQIFAPTQAQAFESQKTPVDLRPEEGQATQAVSVDHLNKTMMDPGLSSPDNPIESTSHFAFPEELLYSQKNPSIISSSDIQTKKTAPIPQNPSSDLNSSSIDGRSTLLYVTQSPEPSRFSTPLPQNQDNGKVTDVALLSVFDQGNQHGEIKIEKKKSKLGLYIAITICLLSAVIFFVVQSQQPPSPTPPSEPTQNQQQLVQSLDSNTPKTDKTAEQEITKTIEPNPQSKPDQQIIDATLPINAQSLDQGIPNAQQADALVISDVEISAEDVIDLEISEIDVQGLKTTKPNSNAQGNKKQNTGIKTTVVPTINAPAKAVLTRGDIAAVVSQNQGAITSCLSMDDSLKGTTQNVQIKIQKNGTVSSSQATSPKLRNSSAKGCIENKIKALKFPAFTGEPMDVPLPLKF